MTNLEKRYDLDSWRQEHFNQLRYSRNLLLIFGTAILAYAVNQKQTLLEYASVKELGFLYIYNWGFIAWDIGVVMIVLSISLGLLAAIKQSRIYRIYFKIGRVVADSHTTEMEEIIKLDQDKIRRMENTV